MAQSADVRALEALMHEFFGPHSDSARQAQIETHLRAFLDQSDSWQHALTFLDQSHEPHVLMYALNILQTWIHARWLALSGPEHVRIRQHLDRHLVAAVQTSADSGPTVPAFVRRKLMRLLVDIARSDWPHFYPEFAPRLHNWLATPDTRALGLEMLLIASEELATPRADLPTARQLELRKLLELHMDQFLSALVSILSTLLASTVSHADRLGTPPPSPSGHPRTDPVSSSGHVLPGLGLTGPSAEMAALALSALAHLYSWLPLAQHLPPELLQVLCQFTVLGLNSQADVSDLRLNALAMSVLNEILYKNCVPQSTEDALFHLFQSCFHLLERLLQTDQAGRVLNLDQMDETFLDKVIEFVRVFMGSHFHRFETNAHAHVVEFMSLVFKLTFVVSKVEMFVECLEIWETLIAYVSNALSTRNKEGHAVLLRYKEGLLGLVDEMLNKIQFQKSHEFLQPFREMDQSCAHQEVDEWRGYLSTCIEVIMKVSDLLSEEVLKRAYWLWREMAKSYFPLADHKTTMSAKSPQDQERLFLFLKDFSSVLTLMGRLSTLFIGEFFLERLHDGHEMMKELITLTTFNSRNRFYALDLPKKLKDGFVQVQVATIASLKAWCHWLAQLHAIASADSHHEVLCKDLTSAMVLTIGPVIRQRDSPALVHSAAHFLVTLTGTVRPPSIWKLKEFTDLYSSIGDLNLASDANRLVIRALANVLLLPWPGLPDQRWDERQKHLSKFLRSINAPFLRLNSMPNFMSNREEQIRAESVVLSSLEIIQDLVESVLSEKTQSKRLCYHCIKDFFDTSLAIFPVYLENTRVCKGLFSFFHKAFDVLKTQMGATTVENAIQTILSTFGKNQMKEVILNEGSSGMHVAESFLAILDFVVKEPNASFRKFVTDTLNLVINDIYPLVADKPTAEIKCSVFRLLYNILLYNMRLFFKPSVVKSLVLSGRDSNDSSFSPNGVSMNQDKVEHQAEFMAILQAFGQSFLQPDVTLFQQNVASLEDLNHRWKLYHKPIFVEHFTEQFLSVFFQVLLRGSHNLLSEEITLCIYHMASVDFEAFFNRFVPYFLEQDPDLDLNQKQILHSGFKSDQDLPTFLSNANRFVTDFKYYKLCNLSLKADPVTFN
ncbi:exportin-6-A-like [Tigriopus californicus]|uniref:exportin-6-A-like n=1 Tax=Tigriopus californicus TaxID=6832 RepID=UPI0027DA93FF|nr:exportin-6-A-like [Tigriopus californicus]